MTLAVRVVDVSALSREDDARLVELVARTFPNEAAPGGPLHAKWTYDTTPSFVVLAEEGAELVGVRVVIERVVDVPLRTRIAGLGIAVDPAWQRRGVGRELTRVTLEECRRRRFDVALAFLFTSNSERLLASFGFARLRARVSYVDRATGERVVEQSPAWARDIAMQGAMQGASQGAVARIEEAGALDLGIGTW